MSLAVNEMALDELVVNEMALDDLTPHQNFSQKKSLGFCKIFIRFVSKMNDISRLTRISQLPNCQQISDESCALFGAGKFKRLTCGRMTFSIAVYKMLCSHNST